MSQYGGNSLRGISASSILTHSLRRPEVGVLAGGSRFNQDLANHPDLHLFVDADYGLLDIGRLVHERNQFPSLYRQVNTLLRDTEERASQSFSAPRRPGAPRTISELIARTPHMKGSHLIYEINPRCAVLVYVRRSRSGQHYEINPITYVL